MSTYKTGALRWAEFCHRFGIPLVTRECNATSDVYMELFVAYLLCAPRPLARPCHATVPDVRPLGRGSVFQQQHGP